MFCGLSLLLITGCQVSVGGKERPLVRHSPIHGSLEIESDHKIEERTSFNTTNKNTTTEMLERLRLETSGDIFHPNMLLFDAMVALGLRQHRYDVDGETDNGTGDLNEYGFNGQLFPTKPYPISFSFSRSEDLIPRQFSSSLLSVRESQGVSLALRNGNWPMRFSYSESQTDQKGDMQLSAVDSR